MNMVYNSLNSLENYTARHHHIKSREKIRVEWFDILPCLLFARGPHVLTFVVWDLCYFSHSLILIYSASGVLYIRCAIFLFSLKNSKYLSIATRVLY